jgi:hypothetical protein
MPTVPGEVPALADLYLRAYESRTQTIDDAVAEMRSAFDGTWGALWAEASLAGFLFADPVFG